MRAPAPDWIGQITGTASVAVAGDVVPVSRVVENIGLVNAASAVDIAYYLSVDDVPLVSDLELGRFTIPPLEIGAFDVDVDAVPVPLTVAAGDYFLHFIIDPDQDREEVRVDNNAVLGSRLSVFPPDLQIVTSALPVARTGAPYQVALIAVGGTSIEKTWSIVQSLVPGLAIDPVGGHPRRHTHHGG
ncbi:MAG: hypothetical protein HC923_07365 [Myxococcales bacterium]|nr:hypothetical protein [Myxococcales bacterium]